MFGIEASGDMRVTRSLTLGPYLGLRVGRYGSVNIPDENQAAHVWFALGLRGAFTLSPPHY